MRIIPTFSWRQTTIVSALIAVFLLGSCATDQTTDHSFIPGPDQKDVLQRAIAESDSTSKAEITAGVERLLEGDYRSASSIFNRALMDAPNSATLNYLNGLTYHLMSERGDGDKYELASAGYFKAVQADPTHWMPYYQMGRILLKQKRFESAQEAFANALLLQPDNVNALYGFAMASYYAHDLEHAMPYIAKAAKNAGIKNRKQIYRSAAIIAAAAGQPKTASEYFDNYKQLESSKRDIDYVQNRIQDWGNVHSSGALIKAQQHALEQKKIAEKKAKQEALAQKKALKDAQAKAAQLEEALAKARQGDGNYQLTSSQTDYPYDQASSGARTASAAPVEQPSLDMVLIDGVVMRVSEEGRTEKGNNIIEQLNVALTSNLQEDTGKTTSNGFSNSNFTFTRNLGARLFSQGASQVTYSLNIATSERNYVEVIGRPSLAVNMGAQGQFYSGENRAIALAGDRGGSIESKPIGISLTVTPTSIDGDVVTLAVQMKGESILDDVTVNQVSNATNSYLKIASSYVTTQVKAKIGESVVLGGIKFRLESDTKRGFPILQDIPAVQYFFSKEQTRDERRTVIYMLTVRGYGKTIEEIKSRLSGDKSERLALQELDRREAADWFHPQPTTLHILRDLKPIFREFRTADVKALDFWMEDTYQQIVNQVVPFIYY